MSETRVRHHDLSLVEDLGTIMGPHFGEAAEVAQAYDFRQLQMDFNEIIDRHPAAGDYRGHPNVSTSIFLRRAGEPETAPRLRCITDPSGNLDHKGAPALVVHLEQGLPHADRPQKGKVGSWVMELSTTMGKEGYVWITALGSQKTGRRTREALPGSSIESKLGYQDFVVWMKNLIDEPENLVPAPTRLELKDPTLFARLGSLARSKS